MADTSGVLIRAMVKTNRTRISNSNKGTRMQRCMEIDDLFPIGLKTTIAVIMNRPLRKIHTAVPSYRARTKTVLAMGMMSKFRGFSIFTE